MTAQDSMLPVPLLPSFALGAPLPFCNVAKLGLLIEEKILCSLIFGATGMERITWSIYDVISKGKVASAFLTISRKSVSFFPFSESELSEAPGKVTAK